MNRRHVLKHIYNKDQKKKQKKIRKLFKIYSLNKVLYIEVPKLINYIQIYKRGYCNTRILLTLDRNENKRDILFKRCESRFSFKFKLNLLERMACK